jgi:hypothetical protein
MFTDFSIMINSVSIDLSFKCLNFCTLIFRFFFWLNYKTLNEKIIRLFGGTRHIVNKIQKVVKKIV